MDARATDGMACTHTHTDNALWGNMAALLGGMLHR